MYAWVDTYLVMCQQFVQWQPPSLLSLKVIFIRDGNMGRLIIDGLTVLEDRAQGSSVSWHVSSPIYVGGVPPGKAQKNIQVWGTVCMWMWFNIKHMHRRDHLKHMTILSWTVALNKTVNSTLSFSKPLVFTRTDMITPVDVPAWLSSDCFPQTTGNHRCDCFSTGRRVTF